MITWLTLEILRCAQDDSPVYRDVLYDYLLGIAQNSA